MSLTKAQEIDAIIEKDRTAIDNAPFPEPLPDWVLNNFDELIMSMPQNIHPYSAKFLQIILSKRDNPSDLTVIEGGFVLNVLNSVAPYLIAKDFDEFIEKKAIIGAIMYRFNVNMQKELNKLEVKRANLLKGSRRLIQTV